jgi:hypothetical protein
MRSKTKKLSVMVGAAFALALIGNAPSFAASKHRTQHEPAAHATQARAAPHEQDAATTGQGEVNTMPGYSARPNGMCWEREGGGGHDLSGYWHSCGGSGER